MYQAPLSAAREGEGGGGGGKRRRSGLSRDSGMDLLGSSGAKVARRELGGSEVVYWSFGLVRQRGVSRSSGDD